MLRNFVEVISKLESRNLYFEILTCFSKPVRDSRLESYFLSDFITVTQPYTLLDLFAGGESGNNAGSTSVASALLSTFRRRNRSSSKGPGGGRSNRSRNGSVVNSRYKVISAHS